MSIRIGPVALGTTVLGAVVALVVAATPQHVPASAAAPPGPAAPTPPPSVSPVASVGSATPSAGSSPTSTPPSPPKPSPEVAESVREGVRAMVPGADVGVEVYDQDTGTVLTSLDADQRFASMSVVKLYIALDVLAGNNWTLPDTATRNTLARMLSTSDDAVASRLWEDNGGPAIIDREVRLLGLTGTRPPDDPGEWGATQTTAQDVVKTYRYITDTLPGADRDLLYNAMYNAPETAADGTDQYFGIPDGLPGTVWAIKQGWGSDGPTACFNTTGLVGTDSRYIVVVLTSAPLSDYGKLPRALTNGTTRLASLLTGS